MLGRFIKSVFLNIIVVLLLPLMIIVALAFLAFNRLDFFREHHKSDLVMSEFAVVNGGSGLFSKAIASFIAPTIEDIVARIIRNSGLESYLARIRKDNLIQSGVVRYVIIPGSSRVYCGQKVRFRYYVSDVNGSPVNSGKQLFSELEIKLGYSGLSFVDLGLPGMSIGSSAVLRIYGDAVDFGRNLDARMSGYLPPDALVALAPKGIGSGSGSKWDSEDLPVSKLNFRAAKINKFLSNYFSGKSGSGKGSYKYYYIQVLGAEKFPSDLYTFDDFQDLSSATGLGGFVYCGDAVKVAYRLRTLKGAVMNGNSGIFEFRTGDEKIPVAFSAGVVGVRRGAHRLIVANRESLRSPDPKNAKVNLNLPIDGDGVVLLDVWVFS